MVPPRRPNRPARPGSAAARRRPEPADDLPEGEEGDFEEPPPVPQGPSVTMMVGLGAALLFAILLAMLVFSRRGYMVEVENLSQDPLQDVRVKINGEELRIGDMRSNEINGGQMKCSPGSEVAVIYRVPNRGEFTKKLKNGRTDSEQYAPDFTEFKGRYRIRLDTDGIHETEY